MIKTNEGELSHSRTGTRHAGEEMRPLLRGEEADWLSTNDWNNVSREKQTENLWKYVKKKRPSIGVPTA